MSAAHPPIPRMVSPESEQAIIGGLLSDNNLIDTVAEILLPEHFATESNRLVFTAACSQISRGKACDVVTVYDELQGRLDLAEIAEMAQFMPSSSNMRRYAEIVLERAKSRQLAGVSMEINDLAHDQTKPIDERLETAQTALAKLTTVAAKDDWVGAHAGMLQHMDVLDARMEGRMQRWPTGLCDVDRLLDGGLCPGDLTIVGARPSHGKTAFAMTVGLHMARDRRVAMFSMEMSHMQLNDRVTAHLASVPLPSIIRPQATDKAMWQRVLDAVEEAKRLHWHACDAPGMNINQLRAKARALKRKQGLDVLMVDYIQLMSGSGKDNRAQDLEEVSRGLKNLAKELDIAVMCLAQLSRKADELPYDAMPNMSHLKDCGAIEQDADVIFLLKRPIVCKQDLAGDWPNYTKLAIAKSRQGETGLVNLHFQGDQVRFSNWQGPPPGKPVHTAAPNQGGFKPSGWQQRGEAF